MTLPIVLLALAALAGIVDTLYIYSHHVKETPIACPLHGKCEAVLKSKWSKMFGIHTELFGLLFYIFVLAAALAFIYAPAFAAQYAFVLLGSAVIALLFAGFLLYVQLKILKEYCFYCLLSDAFVFVILVTSCYVTFVR